MKRATEPPPSSVAGSPAAIRVGCSGWVYPHWRGVVYPDRLPQRAWFDYYAGLFDTVEINNTFYRLPASDAFDAWHAQAPAGFLYAVKANRFLTHMKKLKDPEAGLGRFLPRARRLGAHLGPILFQLPPHWRCDPQRLQAFLEALPRDLTSVFEFRDPTWLTDTVYALLDRHGAGFCVHDMPDLSVPRLAVGRVAYVRFHGTAGLYRGAYADGALRTWARWLVAQAARGRPAFAYFNNDAGGQAVRDAQRLLNILRRLRSKTAAPDVAGPMST